MQSNPILIQTLFLHSQLSNYFMEICACSGARVLDPGSELLGAWGCGGANMICLHF